MSFVIDDTVAIDAGSLGYLPSITEQKQIRHIFLSHSHMDHVASLPIFLDNVYTYGPDCPIVHAGAATCETLQKHLFNDSLWPNFVRLSVQESPFLKIEELQAERPVSVDGLSITPIDLAHVVPTFGFLVRDAKSSVAFVYDTLPTNRVWEILNATPNLAGVFLEASFPDSMQWLAEKAGHLTPSMFRAEAAKLKSAVPIYAMHIKPTFHDEIVKELHALNMPNAHVAVPGKSYEF